jgi:hypothetical protein
MRRAYRGHLLVGWIWYFLKTSHGNPEVICSTTADARRDRNDFDLERHRITTVKLWERGGNSPPFVKWDHAAAEVLFAGRFGSKMVRVSSMAQATASGFVARMCRTSLGVPKGIDNKRFQPGALSCLSNIIPRDAVIFPGKGIG